MLNNNYMYYKLNYPKYVILLKSGNFYISFENDALIINKIFGYKIKESNNVFKVGFPVNCLNKVISKFENLRINYLVVSSEIVDISDINDDCYDMYLSEVREYKIYLNRINQINKVLTDNISNPNIRSIINEVEDVLCRIDC